MQLTLHPKRPVYSVKEVCAHTGEVRCYEDDQLVYCKKPPLHAASYQDGRLHSIQDRPALFSDWVATWYVNGVIHRPGDAFARVDVKRQMFEWFHDGLRDRDGGPAVVDMRNGLLQWWVRGVLVYEAKATAKELEQYISCV